MNLGLSSSIVHKIITRSGLAPVTTINELRRSGGSELFREFLAWINTVSTTKGGSSTSSIHLTYLAGARGNGDKIGERKHTHVFNIFIIIDTESHVLSMQHASEICCRS